MVGGAGTDSLTGGLGSDLFDFNAIMETAAGTDRDVITDFAAGDKIDLATIDAILGQPDDQAFAFAAGAAFSDLEGVESVFSCWAGVGVGLVASGVGVSWGEVT